MKCNDTVPKLANISSLESNTQHFHCIKHVANFAAVLLMWVLSCKQSTTYFDNPHQDL